jgi:hypothetical protein
MDTKKINNKEKDKLFSGILLSLMIKGLAHYELSELKIQGEDKLIRGHVITGGIYKPNKLMAYLFPKRTLTFMLLEDGRIFFNGVQMQGDFTKYYKSFKNSQIFKIMYLAKEVM